MCYIVGGRRDEKTESILIMTSTTIGNLNANAFSFKCRIEWSHEINVAGLHNRAQIAWSHFERTLLEASLPGKCKLK